MKRTALISQCGRFRYHAARVWAPGPRLLLWMLNPSRADAEIDDPTMRRGVGFARAFCLGGLEVVNLFAYRATDPADLVAAGWPEGPENDAVTLGAAMQVHEDGGKVCVAWGAGAAGTGRDVIVLGMLARLGIDVQCLGVTKGGHPKHPLYLPGDAQLRPLP